MTELILALGAGLLSFLSPCVLPLIPGYISYVSGKSLNELLEEKKVNITPILNNSIELRIFSGLIIILFSLQIIGIINLNFLNFEKRLDTQKSANVFSSVLVGMAFGFGWTPCIGPILGSILALAAVEQTLLKAVLLLLFYSLGLAIPFILSGFLIQKFMLISKNLKRNINIISKTGGFILLGTGILILTNQLQAVGFYLLKSLPFLQNLG
jgi:cytochrome c-type biogenesis protein